MFVRLVIAASLILAYSGPTRAVEGIDTLAQANATILTNGDIVKMVAAGLSEQVIMNAIRQASRKKFDVTPLALIDLKKNKVPDAVIAEMQNASAPPPAAGPSGPVRGTNSTASLSREQAADLIAKSALFASAETVTFKTSLNCTPAGPKEPYGVGRGESDTDYFRRMQAEIANPTIRQDREAREGAIAALRAAGLIELQPASGCTDRQRKPVPGTTTKLTPKGVEAAKQWQPVDSETWQVPMARRAVVAVTGIQPQGEAAVAEFSWRWVSPQPGVTAGIAALPAKAFFRRYDDGWRLDYSTMRDYFYDGWGKLIAPPRYGSSVAAPSPSPTETAGAAPSKSLIQIGQTIAQVEATLGQPQSIAKLGPRIVYFYKSLKVTFADGKVVDQAVIQP